MMNALCCLSCFCVYFSYVASCPNGWIQQSGSCYHFSKEANSWFDAMKMCQLHGGNLVHIDDPLKDRFIINLMHKNNCEVAWLGASDWTIEGVWVWEPHGSSMNYTNWGKGRPNDVGGENCLLIDGSVHTHHSYKWDDRGCDSLFCSICEMLHIIQVDMSRQIKTYCTTSSSEDPSRYVVRNSCDSYDYLQMTNWFITFSQQMLVDYLDWTRGSPDGVLVG